jgi:hypothetical protein
MRSWPLTMLQLESTSSYQNLGNFVPRVALARAAGTETGRI